MPFSFKHGIEQALGDLDTSRYADFNDEIPFEPERFYPDFGYIRHPATGQLVTQLADYQYETWRQFQQYRRMLEIKSHKVGATRAWLIVDFQLAVLPSSNPLSCRGFDEIILSQTKDLAIEHLRHLRRAILRSEKYSKYLIDKPQETSEYGELSQRALMRDEKSKTEAIYIKNPDDPTSPTRIIALGADNPGSIESWPNIHHIHVSDITATRRDYKESLNIAMTRLANTNGTMVIETIPGNPAGPIFDMYNQYLTRTVTGQLRPGDFYVKVVTADMAVKAGVISQQFLDAERERDPQAYRRLYLAEFASHGGNVFSVKDIERAIELGKQLDDKYGPNYINREALKSYGVDAGFGSSNFGECCIQITDNLCHVILADEDKHPNHTAKIKQIYKRMEAWGNCKAYIDGSNASVIRDLKREYGENVNYEEEKENENWWTIRPIPFSKYHKELLGHSQILMQKGLVAISPRFTKLIDACRTATEKDGSLDKENTLYDDCFDAFRLALFRFQTSKKDRR